MKLQYLHVSLIVTTDVPLEYTCCSSKTELTSCRFIEQVIKARGAAIFSSYGMLHNLHFATPNTFYDDSFVFIYAGNYRLRLSGRRRQLMAKSDHIYTMRCSTSILHECIADLRLQLVPGKARRAFSHRYDDPPSSRPLSMMNGTGLRQYTTSGWL